MGDVEDVFLLAEMDATRLTVYELDLSQIFFNWKYDIETLQWAN